MLSHLHIILYRIISYPGVFSSTNSVKFHVELFNYIDICVVGVLDIYLLYLHLSILGISPIEEGSSDIRSFEVVDM